MTNAGFEGITFRRAKGSTPGRIFVCQEYQPMRVLQFDWEPGSPPYTLKTYADGSLTVYEPWDAQQVLSGTVSDIAGMAFDESSGTLLIVSQISSRVIRVNPDTGAILEQLALSGTSAAEGLAMFNGCRLAVMSEPRHLQWYEAQ